MDTRMQITGFTKLVGLIGSPVAHSSSPEIHNAVFEKLGRDCAYVALDVAEGDLEAAVRGLQAIGFYGYNVTAPHKTHILPYLDEVSKVAEIMGSVNTVVIQNGCQFGENADGAGFMRNLVMQGVNVIGKKMTVIGAGGAASAVIVQAALDGVAEIDVYNRRDEYWDRGLDLIGRLAEHSSCKVTLRDLADADALRTSLASSVLLVHATNVGTPSVPGCLVDEDMIVPGLIVADMVYVPRETELIARARACGSKVIDGVGTFIQQAAIAERLWFGIDMPLDYVADRFFSEDD